MKDMADNAGGTGEIFLMRPVSQKDMDKPTSQPAIHAHEVLQQTIERCGGTVHLLPPAPRDADASSMYVRDAGFILHTPNQKPIFFTPQQPVKKAQGSTIKAIVAAGVVHPNIRSIQGKFEGGNVIFDPSENTLYWGTNNYHKLWEMVQQGQDWEPKAKWAKEELAAEFARRAMPYDAALGSARDNLESCAGLKKNDKPLRIVHVPMPDAWVAPVEGDPVRGVFHLDGALNFLPTGEAMLCEPMLPHSVTAALNHKVQFHITPEEASRGATNFITVGKHVITPYASEAMKEFFQEAGYTVIDPPSVGLPEGAWRFGHYAGVRCATLKTTPDLEYPVQAAAGHLREPEMAL